MKRSKPEPGGRKIAKHERIYEHLYEVIRSGERGPGDRLPSESELSARFGASRPTVARALRDLTAAGWIERRAGSGSYVRHRSDAATGLVFGLLAPGLNRTEIFEPICSQIARSLQASRHALLWSHSGNASGEAGPREIEALCDELIDRSVAGVFFAPLELSPTKDRANRRILEKLDRAGVAVVLLDGDLVAYPDRSPYDLVGIDNRRAGFVLTRHLLKSGCKRVDWVARPFSASTVGMRIAGCEDALRMAGIVPDPAWVHSGDPEDLEFVRSVIRSGASAIICANDLTAGELLHSLDALRVSVPDRVRVVGFDDVRSAKLLRIPLTTIRQPCAQIGIAAVEVMLGRIANPAFPARNVQLDTTLAVRRSCGARGR